VPEEYVSRAGLKLASVAKELHLKFNGKTVLDVGSSTGGFTEYALRHGAKKVIAVDVGTDQLHQSLRGNPKIELHEKTDIREVCLESRAMSHENNDKTIIKDIPDIVLMDVSFISARYILPTLYNLTSYTSLLIIMVKPQFEAGKQQINKGVIKNDTIRRQILKDFEQWVQGQFIIRAKADSKVAGSKGNVERFYVLAKRPEA
jgi:23S rRNA (cytidine1920-2'-O)/16S rRNA (cytidine1409-2'-O)-methyltransferase